MYVYTYTCLNVFTCVLHEKCFLLGPWQAPSYWQWRSCVATPPPHVLEHALGELHSPHGPTSGPEPSSVT